MTYATQQLTEALQQLAKQESQTGPTYSAAASQPLNINQVQLLSNAVDAFLRERQEFSQKAKATSIGSY